MLYAIGASWPGDSNSSNVGWGQWSWVDGTDASNLNCYTRGCNLWSTYVEVWLIISLSGYHV